MFDPDDKRVVAIAKRSLATPLKGSSGQFNATNNQEKTERPSDWMIAGPEWLERIFLTFSLVYGPAWNDRVKTQEALEIMKSIWLKKLSKYSPEIIEKAIDKSLENRFPELSVVLNLCEQFQAANRYKEYVHIESSISSAPKFHPNGEPSPLLAEYMKKNPPKGGEGKAEFDRLLTKLKKEVMRYK